MADQTERKTLGWKIFREMLPVDQKTLIGTVVFFALIVAMGWIGINEPARMEEFTAQYEARSIQRGASIYYDNCATCHGLDGKGLPGVAPALNAPDLFDGTRLAAVGWTGTLHDYVLLTVSAGRPVKSDPGWANPMPTWGQDYGGPLRPDQVRDVTNFVLNWGKTYEAGAEIAGPRPTPQPTATPPPPVSVEELIVIADQIADGTLVGDPARGEALYKGSQLALDGAPLACNACHTLDGSVLVGPSFQGVSGHGHLEHVGYTAPDGVKDPFVYYLVESIWLPDAFKVPGFENVVMPANFSARMSEQDLADIIAFLRNQ